MSIEFAAREYQINNWDRTADEVYGGAAGGGKTPPSHLFSGFKLASTLRNERKRLDRKLGLTRKRRGYHRS